MYRVVKGTKYVLFPEYLKLTLNCSCVQKENTNQREIFHLVEPITLQNKAAVDCINWEFKFSMKSTMSMITYFTFYRNNKFYSKSLKHTSFSI